MKVVCSLVSPDPAQKRVIVMEPRGRSVLVAQSLEPRYDLDKPRYGANLDGDVDRALRNEPHNCGATDVVDTGDEVAERLDQFLPSILELRRPDGIVFVEIDGSTTHISTVLTGTKLPCQRIAGLCASRPCSSDEREELAQIADRTKVVQLTAITEDRAALVAELDGRFDE